jgi:initiation factor 1A
MVKNFGGNKAKGYAAKNFTKQKGELRVSKNELEVYAQVTKILGGTMCHVKTLDGIEMLCHIRGKFRGRGKRDNYIGNGTWMLVGLRDWEDIKTKVENKSGKEKILNCDVIEVYSELEKNDLKSTITNINWKPFISNDTKMFDQGNEDVDDDDDCFGFEFASEKTIEYQELMKAQLKLDKDPDVKSANDWLQDDSEIVKADDI